MAKQSGIHQLRGKVGGMSYYRQKDVSEGLARRINEGMSKRVKEDAAFANTRLNSAEFGSAGSFAGAVVRSITNRWRTILKPFTTGQMVPVVLDFIKQDTSSPWGQRDFMTGDWKEPVLSFINSSAKNEWEGRYLQVGSVSVTGTAGNLQLLVDYSLPSTNVEWMRSKGVDGIVVQVYMYRITKGQYQLSSNKYLPSYSSVFLAGSDSLDLTGGSGDIGGKVPFGPVPAEDATTYVGCLVVALPFRTVGNVDNTMQELCSFKIFDIPTA